jgi:hypothetical protein
MSEAQEEKKEEEKPDLRPFLGLIEHLSRFFDFALGTTLNLPDQVKMTIRDDDSLDINKKVETVHEIGRVYQLLRLLQKLYVDDFAEDFFNRPKNVKRLMTTMSYLAEAYWAYKDKKVDNFYTVENAISDAINNLEDFLIDVINSAFSDDPDDDYSDDDESDDDSS